MTGRPRIATMKKALVRRSFDIVRWAEQVVSPSSDSPNGRVHVHRTYEQADVSVPMVSLTFDDGPHPDLTPKLLDVLKSTGAQATFYVIGENAKRHPAIVERAFQEGHEIGNHTWSHRFLTTQRSKSILDEIRLTDEVITDITGQRPRSLRPPYGATTKALTRWIAAEFGYDTVLWSVDSKDYEGDPSPTRISERILDATVPGSIVLAHDPLDATVAAMSDTIRELTERGYQLAPVSDLISTS